LNQKKVFETEILDLQIQTSCPHSTGVWHSSTSTKSLVLFHLPYSGFSFCTSSRWCRSVFWRNSSLH